MDGISSVPGFSAARHGLRSLLLRERLLEVDWISELDSFDEPPFGPRLVDFEYLDSVAADQQARVQVVLATEYLTWVLARLRSEPPTNGIPLVALTFIDDTEGHRLMPRAEPLVARAPIPNLLVIPGPESPEPLPVNVSNPSPLVAQYATWLADAAREGLASPTLRAADWEALGESPYRLVIAEPQWFRPETAADRVL